ncbi:DOG1 domain-containing protein [Heracleum sosnowskyi]|uniref:DOG1 domain-containing protein n=1 Tax=Heracleum sosnowskyi TaxID=360622 RepID=A0AAD8H5A0_9APIA|nr:DOG1 domain-containing protein [Heracleum sosnowskyi]
MPTHNASNFQDFYQRWTAQQKHHLDDLVAASQSPQRSQNPSYLRDLVKRVVNHYEEYYRNKSHWAKQDVIRMLSPTWTTPLEQAFFWIGGWRPTMAIHLLYSKSGLQLQERIADVAMGLATGDLADLNASQIDQVDKLQRRTTVEEREISEKMAKQQGNMADSDMVELAHELDDNGEKVELVLRQKEEGLERVLRRADELRLRTLKGVINILTPSQSLHFLVAAAELHLRLHDWGKERETKDRDMSTD